MDISKYRFAKLNKVNLSEISTSETGIYHSKEDAKAKLKTNIELLSNLQAKLYAHDQYSVLIILQAMDTAGKDGIIKHVMKGLNPQGTHVRSFKQPSVEELDHDYLWRVSHHLPERGQIGIFNRSYYEEVLVVRVHNLIKNQRIPAVYITDKIWSDRFRQINDYERYLTENGIIILKLFLHISKDEQKERLLSRIEDSTKNWKFSANDLEERKFWDDYQQCYEETIHHTSTENAPWYIIPSDKKWFSRLVVSEILIENLKNPDIQFPKLEGERILELEACKIRLINEGKTGV